ncbi:MAG TPA: VOC family protein [Polyangiaceae bacterium]|nr:VOC family protein [Polyangiaceae bacterium]
MPQLTASKITPFLWFDSQAAEAAAMYCEIFENSRILDTSRAGEKVMSVTFELSGQRIMALNGGPHYKLNPAFSLFVSVETQAELDRIWEALLAGGGEPTRCGWLVDRFGLSWQVIPTALPRLMSDPDPARAGRAVQAMMGMIKLDIAGLERAANGG